MSGPAQPTVRLSVPAEGIRAGDVILRFPKLEDVDAILPAFTDPALREAGNLPAFDRDALVASIHDLPTIGYFVLPHARRRGYATTIARLLAEHAFSLGMERVAAYVNVGNAASDGVADRAGFTREGIVRSMPKPDGRRVDKTLCSLLPGE
jgi:GNAT superfamily N-acetyltransferase